MGYKAKGREPNGPVKKIDWKYVDRMLATGCNGVQIAATLGIHQDTLYQRCEKERGILFSKYTQEKRACGDKILYEKQFELAEKKDRGMLIWLGKNRLGQKDNHDLNINMDLSSLKEKLEKGEISQS